jgi:two-component system, response regulator / RNA-binding antiterminator
MTEPEAYRRLRRMAMDRGQKLGSVAASVVNKS